MTEPLRLYTFSISHFSEKIRWTLGLENIAFEEVPWTPPFHVVPARMSGSATTVPVLEAGSARVQDSTRIVHWLDTHKGPLTLLPRDEATRQAVLDAENRFDAIGDDVIRLAYAHVLPDTDAVVKLWSIDASPMQMRALRVGFPLFRVLYRHRLDTSDARVSASRERLEGGLSFIEQRIKTHPFLVGDQLSLADITAASLLAPLACPDEHPVYASTPYRAGIAALADRWSAHPAFAWVRRTYREHRGAWPRAAHVSERLRS